MLDDGARDAAQRLGAVSDLEFAVARERPEGPVLVAAGDNLFRFPLGELLEDYEVAPRNLVPVHRETDPQRLRRPGHFVAWLASQEPVFAHRMRGARLDLGDLAGCRAAESWLDAVERAGLPGKA